MRSLPVILALVATLVLAAPAGAAVKRLEANLSGTSTSDANGSGTAKLRLDRAKKKVCFTLRVKRIGDVAAAHIHAGGAGVDGSIVVDLVTEPEDGDTFTGCTTGVAKSTIRAILDKPRRYYVNVHTTDHPGGAVRGQLHKPPENT